jgi:hypothetical protein
MITWYASVCGKVINYCCRRQELFDFGNIQLAEIHELSNICDQALDYVPWVIRRRPFNMFELFCAP